MPSHKGLCTKDLGVRPILSFLAYLDECPLDFGMKRRYNTYMKTTPILTGNQIRLIRRFLNRNEHKVFPMSDTEWDTMETLEINDVFRLTDRGFELTLFGTQVAEDLNLIPVLKGE